jgi:DhnA family fructose-bisphosphate aldolase class Ia
MKEKQKRKFMTKGSDTRKRKGARGGGIDEVVTTYGVLNRTFWNSERKEFLFVLKVSTFLRNTRLTITLGHPKKIVTCNRVTTIGSIAVSYRLHGENL